VAEDPAFRMAASPGLVADLSKAAEADVTAGMSWRPGLAGVPVAGAEASEVLRLALEQGRPAGTYRLDDVLLEYVLSRPSEAGGKLADLLAPLRSGPELVATLEGYFAADFDRRRAAASLNIHPNTLDYRLRRVHELTGLSLSTAHGLQVLGAALTARRLGGEG
jgi:sugar diacid utilization regulator